MIFGRRFPKVQRPSHCGEDSDMMPSLQRPSLQRSSPQRAAIAALLIVSQVTLAFAAADVIVKKEPPLGKMTLGQRLLVDDGSCPAGQIREVIGGDHVKVGGTKAIERTWKCIPR